MTEEIQLRNFEVLEESFNDTCIHSFSPALIAELPDRFWKLKPMPPSDPDDVILDKDERK